MRRGGWARLGALALGVGSASADVGAARAGSHVDGGAPTAIARSEYLTVDGARLFLTVRGADRRAPVLLWLHGGPGGAERPLFRYYDGDLERWFVVAYWDQRGSGRSFDAGADPKDLTIARHLADLDAVVGSLRADLDPSRVVLVGHSWGGALALLYARAHPEAVSAVIAVAPLVDTVAQQRAQHEFLVAEATRRDDRDALERLERLGRPPYGSADAVLAAEALADRYGAVFHDRPRRIRVMLEGMLGGLVTPWEIPRFIRGNDVSLAAMNDELSGLDLAKSVPSVDVPVFFFLGRYDRHADAAVAARYLEALKAPAKRVVWFEDSAHNPPFEEPQAFMRAVVEVLHAVGIGS